MKPDAHPVTPAVRALRALGVAFEAACYDYQDRGGTRVAAAALGLDEHAVVKTLVMEADGEAVIVLMHGDREVSTKALARLLGVKRVLPVDPVAAQRVTGYQVGGTSPFGTRRAVQVLVERTVMELERVWINGGQRGFLVAIAPAALRLLDRFREIEAAQPG